MTDNNVRGWVLNPPTVVTFPTTGYSFNLPTGLSVGDPLAIFGVMGTGTLCSPIAPAGWTLIKPTTAMGTGSFWVMKRVGGWQTTDGSSVFVNFTNNGSTNYGVYVSLALKGSIISDFGTGTFLVYTGGSQAGPFVAPATPDTTVGDDILTVFFGKMSGNSSPPIVTPDAQLIVSSEQSGSAYPNLWIGSYTLGIPEDQHITYSGPTANGAGAQIPLIYKAVSNSPILRGIISNGVEVTPPILRGIISSGVETTPPVLKSTV